MARPAILLLGFLLALATGACGGSSADGDTADGDPVDGDPSDGDAPEGEPDGDPPDGDDDPIDQTDQPDQPDQPETEEGESESDEDDLPPPVCTAGTRWLPGIGFFREATAEWGLTGVEGYRISVTDLDSDGWADLIVRNNPAWTGEDESQRPQRIWLLRNRAGAGFEDVTFSSGLLTPRVQPGVRYRPSETFATADVDNDGFQDIFSGLDTASAHPAKVESNEVLLSNGDGTFRLGPEENPVRRAGVTETPASPVFTDYDRDGLIDLWLPQSATSYSFAAAVPDRLWKGDGSGRFVDVSADMALMTVASWDVEDLNQARTHSWAWSGLACDLNDDGHPELLAASYGRAPNHLFQSVAAGPGPLFYVNRSVESGYAYDDDMRWQDNQFARCYCRSNRQAEGCADVPAPQISCTQPNWDHASDRQPWRLGGNSGTTVCADVNNDGHLDLLTTEIRHWWAGQGADHSELLLNTGEADVRFTRPGQEATGLRFNNSMAWGGWDEGHMTAAVFDFDNDAWPDVYIGASDYPGNRGLLFHQESPALFREVGTNDFFEHNRSHGVVAADFDRDGDLDIVVGHSRARCDAGAPNDCYATQQVRLFENTLGQNGNWLQVRLAGGPGANRAAIGARVTVAAGGVVQTQEVGGGHGHFNTQSDLTLHFGLGTACEAEVTVRWPDAGLTTESHRLPAGHRFELPMGGRPRSSER